MTARAYAVAAALVCALGLALVLPAFSLTPRTDGSAVHTELATEALLLGVTRAGGRIVAVGEYGDIVLSDDEGKTWRQAKRVPTTVTLTAVHFVDAMRGWAVGHDTVILTTADAGETWVKQYGGGESDNALLSVYFKDGAHGWAVGAFNFTVETTDAGRTWVERKTLVPVVEAPAGAAAPEPKKTVEGVGPADPYAAATGDENHLNAMFEGPDPQTLFVAAEAGAVYRSLDGGASWHKILTGYQGSFWGGLTAKDGSVYLTGMRGNIWRSTDKGATWLKLDTAGADQSIAQGLELEDGSFVFVGLGGQVLYSKDGRSFTLTYRPDRKGLNAVIRAANALLVFGEAGIKTQSLTPNPDEIDVPLPPSEGG